MTLTDDSRVHLEAHHRDFADFAQTMVETHAGRFDDVFWGFFDRYRPKVCSRIVDLGTGPGLLLPALKQRVPGATVVGVEAQPEMLKKARAVIDGHEGVSLVEHDLASPKVDLDSASVDIIVASVLVHELPVPTTMLDECARLLRPGGCLFVYDWARQPLATYFDGQRPTTADDWTHFSEHCRLTGDDLAWLIEQSGFSIDEWVGRKNGRFVLLAAKRRTT